MSARPTLRPPLTRESVLEAALAICDREGAGALTMRRLGSALEVQAMSLYNHVAGKEEVLDGLSEVMVARIGVPERPEGWQSALRQFMNGIRSVAHAHSEAFLLVGMRPLNTPAALPPVERLLAAMREGGFSPADASHAYRLAVSYARGFALAEIGGFTLDAPDEHLRAPDLSSQDFPQIVESAPHLTDFDRDAAFEFGVETIIAGLASPSAS